MKKLRYLLLTIIMMLPFGVFASSGSLSISSNSSLVVGNTLTVTVTLSSSSALGSWEFDLDYDSSYLRLSSSTAESGGTHFVGYASNSSTKSKSYTLKFVGLKSGTTKIAISSYDIYDFNEGSMSISASSKSVKLMTQAELEASYSDDAYLKNLSVDNYEITPSFDKSVYEYSLEVENDVTSVNINATKNDSSASVTGAGTKELEEGTNNFEIVVTAQKGNSLTYKLSITRKELNPIVIENKGTIVRKKDLLPEVSTFVEATFTYGDEEIPGLTSETLGLSLVGLKDEEGNVTYYVYDDENDEVKDKYIEVTSKTISIYPSNIPYDNKLNYKQTTININGKDINAYILNEDSGMYIIYGKNLDTLEDGYYIYSSTYDTIIPYSDIKASSIDEKIYQYIIVVLGAILLLLFILLLKKNKNKKEDVKENINDIEASIVEETKVKEEKPKKEKKKKNKKEEKKEEVKEEPQEVIKVEKIEDKDELDDLLDDNLDRSILDEDDDDFEDFWETRELKLKEKKKIKKN